MPTDNPTPGQEQETALRHAPELERTDLSPLSASAVVTVIDNRFVLEQRLGGGGMGVVYRARDRLMEESDDPDPYVAIKLISDAIKQFPQATLALQREARRSQTLSHPNIVKVFHFGRDGDAYYLTMELLRGKSFEQLIDDHPAGLALERARPLIEQLCAGLTYAHEQRIVHSDIKPSNIFLTDNDVVKVLDFGIASPLRTPEGDVRETLFNPRKLGAVSPRYSSLEMWLGMEADPRDDVFSAACVIYELLTGRHPYGQDKAPQALEKQIEPAPVPALSRSQNNALRQALSLRREQRTTSIAQLAASLVLKQKSLQRKRPAVLAVAVAITVGLVGLFIVLREGSQSDLSDADRAAPNETTDLYRINPPQLPREATRAMPDVRSEIASAPASTLAKPDPVAVCGQRPSSDLVDALVTEGLAFQAELSFAADAQGEKQARAGLLKTRECLEQLQVQGLASSRSRQWLTETRAIAGLKAP